MTNPNRFPIYESIPVNTRVERGKYVGAKPGYVTTWEGVERVSPSDQGVVDYAPAPPGYLWAALSEATLRARGAVGHYGELDPIVELWPLRETIIIGPPGIVPRRHGTVPR